MLLLVRDADHTVCITSISNLVQIRKRRKGESDAKIWTNVEGMLIGSLKFSVQGLCKKRKRVIKVKCIKI